MTDSTESKNDNTLRNELVAAMLVHVPFDGWGASAVLAAAADCGIDADVATKLVPSDIAAISVFSRHADKQMAESVAALTPAPSGKTETIKAAILCRLENATPHREAISQALKILASPRHARAASKLLYGTVDRMWRIAGDASVDLSFYTKRATLAGVYSATVLYWLTASDAEPAKVKTFLERRLRDAAIVPKAIAPAKKAAAMGFKLMGRIMARATENMPKDSTS